MNCNFKVNTTFGDKNGACIIEFSMKEYGAHLVKQKAVCVLTGYPDQDSVSKGSSYDKGLSDKFYQELDNCISGWEARASGKL